MRSTPLLFRSTMTALPPPRTLDDPACQAARLLARVGVFLLFVIAQAAPILIRQTIYVLLPVGAALLLASAAIWREPRESTTVRSVLLSPPAVAVVLLAAWTGFSLAWTPFDGPGERYAKAAATLALVGVACVFLPARTKTSNLYLLPIGAGVAAATLALVVLLTEPKYTLDNILDVGPLGRAGLGLALLVWPAMGALAVRGRWVMAGGLAVATAIACRLAEAPNALPALAAGAAVFAVSFGRPRRAAGVLAAGAAAIVLLAPLAAFLVHLVWDGRAPGFLRHLAFWGAMIANDGWRTPIGHGFGAATYGVLRGFLDPATPRSLVFQVWFDLGVIGALILAGVGARAMLAVGGLRPALAPFLLGGLATGLAVAVLGPAAEQLWWLTLAGLDVIAFVLVMRGQFRKERPGLPLGWGEAEKAP